MPLQLGGASTERPQILAFDPRSNSERAEARRMARTLESRGFSVRERSPGKIILEPPRRDPHQGVFRVLSENGDDRIVWDRRDPGQVREAFEKFGDFLKKGYTAYATLSSGKKGHRIEDFDPGMEEIILVPGTMPG